MTNAEARFNNSLRPRKPEGSLGRTAQDVHLDSHTAPELWPEPADSRLLSDVWPPIPPDAETTRPQAVCQLSVLATFRDDLRALLFFCLLSLATFTHHSRLSCRHGHRAVALGLGRGLDSAAGLPYVWLVLTDRVADWPTLHYSRQHVKHAYET